jgi:hypothetical protein
MKTLLILISLSLFANEYLTFNDELVLFLLAFLTQVIIVKSFTPMVTQLSTDTASSLSDNFSKSLSENELGFNNAYSYSINFMEKITLIVNVVENASSSFILLVFQNEIKASVPNYNI